MFRALVMGGGPAGASAALGLQKRGAHVTLLEQRAGWTGRVCGSFLNAEAIRHIKNLGLWPLVEAEGAVAVPRCLLTGPGKLKTWINLDNMGETGYALPRRRLEEILMDSAQSRGVHIKTGTRATDFYKEHKKWVVRTTGPHREKNYETADLLVAGNGRFFNPKGAAKPRPSGAGWYGWSARFEGIGQHLGHLSLHFYEKGYAGILCFSDGSANVTGLFYRTSPDPFLWEDVFQEIKECQPHFNEILNGAKRVSDWQGVGPLPFTAAPRSFENILLTGDAAAVSDPFLGEGLGRSLASGPMISAAMGRTIKGKIKTILEKEQDPLDTLHRSDFFSALHKNYTQLWKSSYRSRLHFGAATRIFLKTAGVNKAFLTFLLSQGWITNRLVRKFHTGFVQGV